MDADNNMSKSENVMEEKVAKDRRGHRRRSPLYWAGVAQPLAPALVLLAIAFMVGFLVLESNGLV